MWYVVVAYVRSHHDYPILPRSYQYFAYTVLRQYLEDHADKTRDWTVLSNARGEIALPYVKHVIAMSTGDVTRDIASWSEAIPDAPDLNELFAGLEHVPAPGPALRENGLLLVEKAARKALLDEAGVGERYGLRIATCNGNPRYRGAPDRASAGRVADAAREAAAGLYGARSRPGGAANAPPHG